MTPCKIQVIHIIHGIIRKDQTLANMQNKTKSIAMFERLQDKSRENTKFKHF